MIPCARKPGFTLVETILVVALIGILLSLLLPALRGVKAGAMTTASVAQARGHAQVFISHTAEHDGAFPHFADPRATQTVLRTEAFVLTMTYFESAYFWNVALRGYYDNQWNQPSFRSPFTPSGVDVDGRSPSTDYYYSHTFVSSPKYWDRETREWDPAMLHEIHADQVRWPSKKVLLVDRTAFTRSSDEHASSRAPLPAAFADGSARAPKLSAFRPGYGYVFPPIHGIDEYEPGMPVYPAHNIPGMTTLNGVHGRDLQ